MNKYPKYKTSGIEWIGDIPEHWVSPSLKRYCTVKRGSSPRPIDDEKYFDDDGYYSWVRISDVSKSERYLLETEERLSELGSSLSTKLEPNDIFVSIAGSVGKPIINKIPCCIHDGFVWFQNLQINKEFLYYLFKIGQCFSGLGKMGTQLNLNTDTIGMISIPLPSKSEQKQIVQFLDEKTELIDKLISTNERKIDLLKSQRTSLINEVITKGLDPNVKMKDSGVEWIGEIPEHWTQIRIGFCSNLLTGNPWKSDDFDFENGMKIVRGDNVSEGFLRWGEKTRYWKNEIVKGDTYFLSEGDIIISMDGSKVGKNYVLIKRDDLPLLLHQRMCRVRCNEILNPYFLKYFIGSEMFRYYIDTTKTDPMIPHITQKDISNFVFSLPPKSEQLEIIKYLDIRTQEIDNLVSMEQKKIDLLKEYRQSLISEVITGKIDVRTNLN